MSAEDDSSDKRQAPSGGGEVRLATLIFFSHTSLYLGHLLEGIIQPKGRSFPSVNPPWAYLQGHIRRSVSRRFQILSSWHHSVIADSLEKIIISALVPTTYCATSQKKKKLWVVTMKSNALVLDVHRTMTEGTKTRGKQEQTRRKQEQTESWHLVTRQEQWPWRETQLLLSKRMASLARVKI